MYKPNVAALIGLLYCMALFYSRDGSEGDNYINTERKKVPFSGAAWAEFHKPFITFVVEAAALAPKCKEAKDAVRRPRHCEMECHGLHG